MPLTGKRLVLGVCGGIAAYKVVELARRLTQAGAEVRVVMTQAATRFVGPLTFSALASEPARVSLWDSPEPIPHTKLLQSVWGADYGEEVEYLRVFINQLRKKIEKNPSNPKYLLTEPWVGYRFHLPV